MANPLTNERELYAQIEQERIGIHPFVWDTMYHYLGDYISAINLIASYYIAKDEPIPLGEARKILEYTRLIRVAIEKVLHPETIQNDQSEFERIKKDNMILHPVIKEFFMHYVGNDTHVINLCVSLYLDPLDESPIPVEDAQKILARSNSMREFLDRLREATAVNAGSTPTSGGKA